VSCLACPPCFNLACEHAILWCDALQQGASREDSSTATALSAWVHHVKKVTPAAYFLPTQQVPSPTVSESRILAVVFTCCCPPRPQKLTVAEIFDRGSSHALKQIVTVRGVSRVMTFHSAARLDGLVRREELVGHKLVETYEGRDDRLCYRWGAGH
jgi:hypothetical protein